MIELYAAMKIAVFWSSFMTAILYAAWYMKNRR